MIPRIRNPKITFSVEWIMTAIQVLRKRQLGNAKTMTPPMTFAAIVQGW